MSETIPPVSTESTSNKTALDVKVSSGMAGFLLAKQSTILMSAYKANKLIALKLNANSEVSIEERTFDNCMGIAAQNDQILVASNHQIWRLLNYTKTDEPGQVGGKFVPQKSWVTGGLKCHDLAFDSTGTPIFVNTMFSCLSRISEEGSFEVVWKPRFISELQFEDRCHLNGLAMQNGKPKFVTAVAETNSKLAWKDAKHDGGIIIDVESNEIISRGLSMPHSPRMYAGKLWLHNSGTGEFGYLNLESGKFNPIFECPGFPRGLSFIDEYALIGTSNYRDERLFHGLPIEVRLKERNQEPVSGMFVLNLKTGRVDHHLQFDNLINELYDVAVLNDPCPSIIGLMGEDIKCNFRVM